MESPAPKPPVKVSLEWRGEMRFSDSTETHELMLDGKALVGVTPVQALVSALAGCMAVDVVQILEKGRHPPQKLRVDAVAVRAEHDPRRLVKVDLRFHLQGGAVPPERVERAIALSRDNYCSVWHSLRTDIELTTSFEIV